MLSMCIQLMQEEIIGKIQWLVTKIGMGKKSGKTRLLTDRSKPLNAITV